MFIFYQKSVNNSKEKCLKQKIEISNCLWMPIMGHTVKGLRNKAELLRILNMSPKRIIFQEIASLLPREGALN